MSGATAIAVALVVCLSCCFSLGSLGVDDVCLGLHMGHCEVLLEADRGSSLENPAWSCAGYPQKF